MWIGCSDSRVPATQITGLEPGEVFVHRNVANLVIHSDMNCLSVLQFAVEVLEVQHIIVCGHYNCGGVRASMEHTDHGLIDNWLRHIRDVHEKHAAELEAFPDERARADRLAELNALEQAYHVCETTFVQNAWRRGQRLTVHGWIYDVHTGLLRPLHGGISSRDQLRPAYRVGIDTTLSSRGG
jgi:carbonic anhydrase